MRIKIVVIIVVVSLSVSLSYLFYKFTSGNLKDNQPITLTYWDFYDKETIQPFLEKFTTDNPKIKITYVPQTLLNYRARAQSQIDSPTGPDVIKVHSSWMNMFMNKLFEAPHKIISLSEFNDTYFEVAVDSLTKDNKVYAIPSELDGIVMYYNEDILKGVNASVPKSWQELIEVATLVTVKSKEGVIQTAGIGLGSTNNIEFWPEIIGMLFFQQPGSNLKNPANQAGAEVLRFYTQFITDPKVKAWDVTLPKDTQMFIDGKLAFYFATAEQAEVIAKANPVLNFKSAPVPQLRDKAFAWGSFYSLAISGKSSHPDESWQLVKYLSSADVQTELFELQIKQKIVPKPYARKDLGSKIIDDPLLGSFVKQGGYYRWWYLNSRTQDQGINDEMIFNYKRAVEDTLQGNNPQAALQNITLMIQNTLKKWGGIAPKHK